MHPSLHDGDSPIDKYDAGAPAPDAKLASTSGTGGALGAAGALGATGARGSDVGWLGSAGGSGAGGARGIPSCAYYSRLVSVCQGDTYIHEMAGFSTCHENDDYCYTNGPKSTSNDTGICLLQTIWDVLPFVGTCADFEAYNTGKLECLADPQCDARGGKCVAFSCVCNGPPCPKPMPRGPGTGGASAGSGEGGAGAGSGGSAAGSVGGFTGWLLDVDEGCASRSPARDASPSTRPSGYEGTASRLARAPIPLSSGRSHAQ